MKLPKFTKREIEFIEDAIEYHDDEWVIPKKSKGFTSILNETPFRLNLMNKITKYWNVLNEEGK